jgi:hypothetical protein
VLAPDFLQFQRSALWIAGDFGGFQMNESGECSNVNGVESKNAHDPHNILER